MGAWLPAPWLLSLVSECLSSLLLAVPPSIEKEDVEDTVKVPEGEMAHLMCNVSGKGHTVDWRRVKRQLWEEGSSEIWGACPLPCCSLQGVPCHLGLFTLYASATNTLPYSPDCRAQPPRSSVQFSHSVVSVSLRSHGLQHARPPCPSPTPEACSNSCPLSR